MLANGRFKCRLIHKIATAEACGNTESKRGNSDTKQVRLHKHCASLQMWVLEIQTTTIEAAVRTGRSRRVDLPLNGRFETSIRLVECPVSDSRRINKRANTSRSPNSVLSVGRAPSAPTRMDTPSVNAARPGSLVLAVGVHIRWRDHGGDDSQQHWRRRNARLASFEPQSLGHNVALRVSAGLSCKNSETLQSFADARALSLGAGAR
jgi:hypothetical protein